VRCGSKVWPRASTIAPIRRPQISVIGGSDASPEQLAAAETVGGLLAAHGCVVVCGGLGGVMEAVARGAKKGGGTTIGILPGDSAVAANPSIDHAVATGIGHARNLAVVASGDAVIAIGGEWGTASEIALARKLRRLVVVLGNAPRIEGDGIVRVATPGEAVEAALSRRLSGREQSA
jgi:uncharacterized protein (TIGR00725 family)